MRIILARHGNTFESSDEAVWAGLKQDYPLVSKGQEQAQELAQALLEKNLVPKAIYCAGLQRTTEYAAIINSILNDHNQLTYDYIVDNRLNELDYGSWGGLSNQEVIDQFGADELEAWNNTSVWPKNADWAPSEDEAKKQVSGFLEQLINTHNQDDLILIVSSNGKLRYFLDLIPGEFQRRAESGSFKIKTGNVCGLIINGNTRISCWNVEPFQMII